MWKSLLYPLNWNGRIQADKPNNNIMNVYTLDTCKEIDRQINIYTRQTTDANKIILIYNTNQVII